MHVFLCEIWWSGLNPQIHFASEIHNFQANVLKFNHALDSCYNMSVVEPHCNRIINVGTRANALRARLCNFTLNFNWPLKSTIFKESFWNSISYHKCGYKRKRAPCTFFSWDIDQRIITAQATRPEYSRRICLCLLQIYETMAKYVFFFSTFVLGACSRGT